MKVRRHFDHRRRSPITASLGHGAPLSSEPSGKMSLTLWADVTRTASARRAHRRRVGSIAEVRRDSRRDYATTARAKMSVSCRGPPSRGRLPRPTPVSSLWTCLTRPRRRGTCLRRRAGPSRRPRPGHERARGVLAVVRAPCPDRAPRRHRDSLRRQAADLRLASGTGGSRSSASPAPAIGR